MRNRILLLFILILAFTVFTGCSFNKAGEYYDKGVTAFNQENYSQASQYFKNALELKNDKAEYYIAYGMSLIMKGDIDLAREQFESAIVDKVNSIVLKNNKQAYRGLGICALKEGQYDLAVLEFKNALEISGDEELNEDIRSYLCEAYVYLHEYDNAVKEASEQLKKKESANAYGIRGWIYFEEGKYDLAAKDYETAISMEKGGNLEWYLGIYQSLTKQEDYGKAGEYLNEAVKLKVKDKEDEILMARLLMISGDSGAAKESFEKIAGENTKAYYYLGVISQEEEDYQKACEYFEKYISYEENTAEDTYIRLGMSREAMKNYDLAEDAYKAGREHKGPYQREIYIRSIALFEKQGNFEEAYKLADEYLKENGDDERIKREKQFLSTRR